MTEPNYAVLGQAYKQKNPGVYDDLTDDDLGRRLANKVQRKVQEKVFVPEVTPEPQSAKMTMRSVKEPTPAGGLLGQFIYPQRPWVPLPENEIVDWAENIEREKQTTRAMTEAEQLGVSTKHVPKTVAEEPDRPGLVTRIFDYAQRPSSAFWGGLNEWAAWKQGLPGDPKGAVQAALSGKRQWTSADVMETAGIPKGPEFSVYSPMTPEWKEEFEAQGQDPSGLDWKVSARDVAGFGTDLTVDPMNFLRFGYPAASLRLGTRVVGKGRATRTLSSAVLSDAGESALKSRIQMYLSKTDANGVPVYTPDLARHYAEISILNQIESGAPGLVAPWRLYYGNVPLAQRAQDAVAAAVKAGALPAGALMDQSIKVLGRRLGPTNVEDPTSRGVAKIIGGWTGLKKLLSRDAGLGPYDPYIRDKHLFDQTVQGRTHDVLEEVREFLVYDTFDPALHHTTRSVLSNQDMIDIGKALESQSVGGLQALYARNPHAASVAAVIAKEYKHMREVEERLGLQAAVRADYQKHAWIIPRDRGQGGKITPEMQENYERTFDTIEAGKAAGYVPVTENALELYALRKLSHIRSLAALELLQNVHRRYGFTKETYDLHTSAMGKIIRNEPLTVLEQDAIELTKKVGVKDRQLVDQMLKMTEAHQVGQAELRLIERRTGVKWDIARDYQQAQENITLGKALEKHHTDAIAEINKLGLGKQQVDDMVVEMRKARSLGMDKPVYIPNAIENDLNALLGNAPWPALGSNVRGLVKTYDYTLNYLRGSLTAPWSPYHLNNAVGNVVNSMLDIGVQAANPLRHMQTMSIMKGKRGDLVTELGETFSYSQVMNEARRHGILGAFAHRGEFNRSLSQEVGTSGKLDKSIGVDNPMFRAGRKLGSHIEDEARLHLFTAYVRRGYSFDDAATRVNKFLFDYSNLSPVEKGVMRRFMLFYPWMRKNIPLQAEAIMTQGAVSHRYSRIFMNRGTDDDGNERYLPEDLRSGLAIRIGKTGQGDDVYMSFRGLPVADLNQVLPPGDIKGYGKAYIRNWLYTAVPFIRETLTAATGDDPLTGRDVDPQSNVNMAAIGKIIDIAPPGIKEWLDYRKTYDAAGKPVYKVDTTKLRLVQSLFVSRLYTTAGRLMDENQPIFGRVVSGLTGLTFNVVPKDRRRIQMETSRSIERAEVARKLKLDAIRNKTFEEEWKK